ncbi:MAG: FAD:protein FMN transferase [Oleibacter sp.]|nr:FAD:protein FMN transferase [Thalassolituus sp.]
MNVLRLLTLTVVFLITACSPSTPKVLVVSGPTMGTQYHIRWVETSGVTSSSVHTAVTERLEIIVGVFSTYDRNSELSKLNQQATSNVDKKIAVSAEMMSVMRDAEHVFKFSIGRFDPSVGPLVDLWGFGPSGPHDIPSDDAITALKKDTGFEKLTLYPEEGKFSMTAPLQLDFSAIAKGWAVDDIALLLQAMGVTNYLVEIGGEVRTNGEKPDGPWRIAIERPVLMPGALAQVILSPGNAAVATSGDYRNFFEHNGQRYSHTINPRTGRPVLHELASVSVIMPTCSLADAWATAITVAGPEAGMVLAEANNLPVFMIVRKGEEMIERFSSSFERLYGEQIKAQVETQ